MTAYSAELFSYMHYRTQTRAAKMAWQVKGGTASGTCVKSWGFVLPATYTRENSQAREVIYITVTDCSDPDNITTSSFVWVDKELPVIWGIMMGASADPVIEKCE
jgi:hypothetical protein